MRTVTNLNKSSSEPRADQAANSVFAISAVLVVASVRRAAAVMANILPVSPRESAESRESMSLAVFINRASRVMHGSTSRCYRTVRF